MTTFDAVYYSSPAPLSLESLTYLSLVFDRIHFPGVFYSDDIDGEAAAERYQSIVQRIRLRPDDIPMLNCMRWAPYINDLKSFCVFTGQFGQTGSLEDGTMDLAWHLEECIYGPPPDDFTPIIRSGFSTAMPGGEKASINGPGLITYPANALLYAIKNGLMLINDDPSLPVPAMGGAEAVNNAQMLSTVLALESVKLVLPSIPELSPSEILEFRSEVEPDIRPFRIAMVKLSKELNSMLLSAQSTVDIQENAKFLVQTTVWPELEELRKKAHSHSSGWWKRIASGAKTTATVVGKFFVSGKLDASKEALSGLLDFLVDLRDSQDAKDRELKRSGLYYLLQIENRLSK